MCTADIGRLPYTVISSVSRDVTAIILPNGAHHLDLMFSNDLDPPDAVWARQYELARIQKWIGAKRGVAAM